MIPLSTFNRQAKNCPLLRGGYGGIALNQNSARKGMRVHSLLPIVEGCRQHVNCLINPGMALFGGDFALG